MTGLIKNEIVRLRLSEPIHRTQVPQPDSVEKIVKQLSLLSPHDVHYSGYRNVSFTAPVRKIHLDPSLFQQFICIAGCTACCLKFTLDYTPEEFAVFGYVREDPQGFKLRTISINNKIKQIWTNDQNQNNLCDFLTARREGGGLGCSRWPHAPLSCASAPQFQVRQYEEGETTILKGPFKTAMKMDPRPQCEFHPLEVEDFDNELENLLEILERFTSWARYLNIETVLHSVTDTILECYLRGIQPLKTQTIVL